MNQLLLLIAAAFMVSAAIYLGHQGFRLRRANNLMMEVAKNLNETKPWALTEPQAELRAACELLRAAFGYVPQSNQDLRYQIQTFLCGYPASTATPQSKEISSR